MKEVKLLRALQLQWQNNGGNQMTKEPIMIDDVDVSECEHRCDTHKELLADGHIKEFVHYCQITNTGCYGYNCYYKQLKRKEQECEELLTKIDIQKRENIIFTLEAKKLVAQYSSKLDQLKAEKKKLKNKIKNIFKQKNFTLA